MQSVEGRLTDRKRQGDLPLGNDQPDKTFSLTQVVCQPLGFLRYQPRQHCRRRGLSKSWHSFTTFKARSGSTEERSLSITTRWRKTCGIEPGFSPAQWLVAFLHRLMGTRNALSEALVLRELLDNSHHEYAHRWAVLGQRQSANMADAVGQLPGAASLERRGGPRSGLPPAGRASIRRAVLSPCTKAILPSQEFRAFNLSQERALPERSAEPSTILPLPVPKATSPQIPQR